MSTLSSGALPQKEPSDLIETFSRWSMQGMTDDYQTPIDDYGKRILSMVIRELRKVPSPSHDDEPANG